MSEQKIKVSELPEQEQKDLIAEAYEVGLRGVFVTRNVETLKRQIAEKRGEIVENEKENSTEEQNSSENEQEIQTEEQNGKDEQNGSADEQETKTEEQNGEDEEVIVAGDGGVHKIPNEGNEEESNDSASEELSDEAKKFLNGETDELRSDAEEISEDEAKVLEEKVVEKQSLKNEVKKSGICHICRSRVVNGVCTGCGFCK